MRQCGVRRFFAGASISTHGTTPSFSILCRRLIFQSSSHGDRRRPFPHPSRQGPRSRRRAHRARSVRPRPKTFLAEVHQAIRRAGGDPNRLGSAGKGSGRFNARGRGAAAAAGLKGRNAWSRDGNGVRTRARRVAVKARVVKLNPQRGARAAGSSSAPRRWTRTCATSSATASTATARRGRSIPPSATRRMAAPSSTGAATTATSSASSSRAEDGVELADLRDDHPRPDEADGSRPRDEARLGRGRSPQHRPSPHPYPPARRHRRRQDPQHRRRLHRPRHPRAGQRDRDPGTGPADRAGGQPAARARGGRRALHPARPDADRRAAGERRVRADLRPDRDMLETVAPKPGAADRPRAQAGAHGAGDRDRDRPLVMSRQGRADLARAGRARRHHQDHAPGAGRPRPRRRARPARNMSRTASRSPSAIVGRVLAKGLAGDEMGDRLHLVIDGVDGRTHYVETADAARAGRDQARPYRRARPGADQGRAQAGRPSTSRSWRKPMAASIGRASIWKRRGTSSSSVTATRTPSSAPMSAGWKRLRRAGHVERIDADHWKIPDDIAERGMAYDAPGRPKDFAIRTLSTLDLDRQIGSDGATWLDRELVATRPSAARR